ncbi:hypothetical protein R1flu_027910 [Riccia fluitans]|uniref:GDSL esterase/lipase n=1 Tax=Riccia fluitans TaxID=41844 RepID=A0ABD1XK64_9MARC
MGSSGEGGCGAPLEDDYRHRMIIALLLLISLAGFESGLVVPVVGLAQPCPTGFFSFGDSLSDTGSRSNLFPGLFHSDYPPYGEQFFQRPAKRICNGRLVLDFFG